MTKTTTRPGGAAIVATPRLDLVLVERPALEATLRGDDPGFTFDPNGFLDELHDVIRLRLATIEADASALPWLLRAIVLREEQRAIGLINFHAPPDAERGITELGYEIAAAYRRRGYAREATTAMIAWATANGARIIRACIAPDNAASKATLVGFTHVGEHVDEIDGLELVYERVVAPSG